MITKEILKKDLEKVRIKLYKIPTKVEYKKHGSYGTTTIERRYGSWVNALSEIFEDYIKPEKSIKKNCVYCEKEIMVEPNMIKDKNYCSRSCANKGAPRRVKLPRPKCKLCDEKVHDRRGTYCRKCFEFRENAFANRTIGELREERKDATRYSYVRSHARKIMKKTTKTAECQNCNYDKHVQVCHIKDICDYNDDATVREINSLENLVYLCPNCHWEFDHNLLKL